MLKQKIKDLTTIKSEIIKKILETLAKLGDLMNVIKWHYFRGSSGNRQISRNSGLPNSGLPKMAVIESPQIKTVEVRRLKIRKGFSHLKYKN